MQGPTHGTGLTAVGLWCLLSQPFVFHLWRCLACNLVWFEAVHQVHCLWSLPGSARSHTMCDLLGATGMSHRAICR